MTGPAPVRQPFGLDVGLVPYDVAPDGRFLINTVPEETGKKLSLMVVLNWQAGLKK